MIRRIKDNNEKKQITRNILESLPEWFGIEEAREAYINDTEDKIFFSVGVNDTVSGFLYLKETGKDTVELYCMGVLKECHRKQYGKALVNAAKECAAREGYTFMQVKTVQMGRYREYDATNLFYLNCGFREFEVFPDLWGEENPCQIYVLYLPEVVESIKV